MAFTKPTGTATAEEYDLRDMLVSAQFMREIYRASAYALKCQKSSSLNYSETTFTELYFNLLPLDYTEDLA